MFSVLWCELGMVFPHSCGYRGVVTLTVLGALSYCYGEARFSLFPSTKKKGAGCVILYLISSRLLWHEAPLLAQSLPCSRIHRFVSITTGHHFPLIDSVYTLLGSLTLFSLSSGGNRVTIAKTLKKRTPPVDYGILFQFPNENFVRLQQLSLSFFYLFIFPGPR